MAVVVKLNGTDKSSDVERASLAVDQVLNSQTDTCRFTVKKYGSHATTPALNDTVLIEDGGVAAFGGVIVRITERVEAGKILVYDVEAVSYERYLDRYRAVVEYQNKSALFVLNSLLNDYVNRQKKVILTMETTETWVDEAGTSAADTTKIAYGSRSRKLTASASGTSTSRADTAATLDLTLFDDLNTSTTADKITLRFYVSNKDYLTSVRLRLGGETGATYTNYYETTYSGPFVTGWNQIVVLKSAFTATGSPSWATIRKGQLSITANASGGVDVYFDDLRLIAAAGFTGKNIVGADATIYQVKFNYEQVSEAIRQIAEVLGYQWYIDENRDLYFFPPASIPAPFQLDDTSGNHVYNSLELVRDIANLRNTLYVRGGEELGANQTEDLTHEADGTNKIFKCGYKYSNIVVRKGGVVQTVGIDFIDDPASFQCLYNFEEKTVRFATAPGAGVSVTVQGDPHVPIIIKKRDASSVATYDVFEYRIEDKTIRTREGARQRAEADLNAYREKVTEGRFSTLRAGFKAGQRLTINSTVRGITAEEYIINRLTLRMRTGTTAVYEIGLITSRTYGVIEFLIGLLRKDAKAIEIGQDEVLDLVETFEETVQVSESASIAATYSYPENVDAAEATANYINDPPIFVVAPYAPTSLLLDRKRPAYVDRDNVVGA